MRARQRTICRIDFILYPASLSVLIHSLHVHVCACVCARPSVYQFSVKITSFLRIFLIDPVSRPLGLPD